MLAGPILCLPSSLSAGSQQPVELCTACIATSGVCLSATGWKVLLSTLEPLKPSIHLQTACTCSGGTGCRTEHKVLQLSSCVQTPVWQSPVKRRVLLLHIQAQHRLFVRSLDCSVTTAYTLLHASARNTARSRALLADVLLLCLTPVHYRCQPDSILFHFTTMYIPSFKIPLPQHVGKLVQGPRDYWDEPLPASLNHPQRVPTNPKQIQAVPTRSS